MEKKQITVPDIGGAADVDLIEILVKPGDNVKADDSIVTLEGDKASMEVPVTEAGIVREIHAKVGDKVSEGSLLITLEVESSASVESVVSEEKIETPVQAVSSVSELKLSIPDIGGAENVDVIEVHAAVGDVIEKDVPLVTLEGDKASMEVPAESAGKVLAVALKVGDKVSAGDPLVTLEVATSAAQDNVSEVAANATQANVSEVPVEDKRMEVVEVESAPVSNSGKVHAGPAVRRLARELGVDLTAVKATGVKGRITKEDLKKHLQGGGTNNGAFSMPTAPAIDFSKFGAIEVQELTKINKLSGANLHRNWVSMPHVTQFAEADITNLEAFRQAEKQAAKQQGVRLTPIAFIMKAVVAALKAFPRFNASLSPDGSELILKQYFHIGVAVDTPQGLVVPVIRDVDKKGLYDLARELGDISEKARTKGLGMKDMQGGCFTISSLGGIGGTAFTPIINAPEVAILGVSKSQKKPVFNQNDELEARLMLPLSLSYDHRVIDGAEGARFVVYLSRCLADIRTLLL
jgi:pyruvate dehydrogenase E2 component (dihydrolipoamide acetyltransferase)